MHVTFYYTAWTQRGTYNELLKCEINQNYTARETLCFIQNSLHVLQLSHVDQSRMYAANSEILKDVGSWLINQQNTPLLNTDKNKCHHATYMHMSVSASKVQSSLSFVIYRQGTTIPV